MLERLPAPSESFDELIDNLQERSVGDLRRGLSNILPAFQHLTSQRKKGFRYDTKLFDDREARKIVIVSDMGNAGATALHVEQQIGETLRQRTWFNFGAGGYDWPDVQGQVIEAAIKPGSKQQKSYAIRQLSDLSELTFLELEESLRFIASVLPTGPDTLPWLDTMPDRA